MPLSYSHRSKNTEKLQSSELTTRLFFLGERYIMNYVISGGGAVEYLLDSRTFDN